MLHPSEANNPQRFTKNHGHNGHSDLVPYPGLMGIVGAILLLATLGGVPPEFIALVVGLGLAAAWFIRRVALNLPKSNGR